MEHGLNGEEPPDHISEPDVPNTGGIVKPLPSRGCGQAQGRGRGRGRLGVVAGTCYLLPKGLSKHSFNHFFAKASWNVCPLATACHASASCPQLGIVCGSDTRFSQAYCPYESDKNHSVRFLNWRF